MRCPYCDSKMDSAESLSGGWFGASPELISKVKESIPNEYYCKKCDLFCDEDGEVIDEDEEDD